MKSSKNASPGPEKVDQATENPLSDQESGPEILQEESKKEEHNGNPEALKETESVQEKAGEDSLAFQIRQFQEKLLRAQADFDNFRKRSLKEKEEIRRFANAALIEELLPILDNFELGLKSVEAIPEVLAGFQMVLTQLQTVLAEKGLEAIAPENQPFDPLQEEAVAYLPDENVPEGNVVRTTRKGYSLSGKLLRPALVVVSKGTGM